MVPRMVRIVDREVPTTTNAPRRRLVKASGNQPIYLDHLDYRDSYLPKVNEHPKNPVVSAAPDCHLKYTFCSYKI